MSSLIRIELLRVTHQEGDARDGQNPQNKTPGAHLFVLHDDGSNPFLIFPVSGLLVHVSDSQTLQERGGGER